jgi:hypothetical protein
MPYLSGKCLGHWEHQGKVMHDNLVAGLKMSTGVYGKFAKDLNLTFYENPTAQSKRA